MAVDRDELRRWDREIVWHPFTQMAEYEPLVIERAAGCTLVDIDGREYLDGISSLWCNIHGHRHPALDAALRDQLDRVAHVTALGSSNPSAIRLAKRLTEIAPAGLAHVFFSDNGATSVEVALKMAFQYWRQCREPRPEKTAFVALGDAYHGDTVGSMSLSDLDRFNALFRPLLFEVLRLPVPQTYRLPPGISHEQAREYHLGELEKLLSREHGRIAALVIEPLVQAAAGMITHPVGYLAGVRELTRRFNVLLIADEVAVGFGRTGRMFACEHEQVSPDFLCLAKGISGGYLPMAATLTTDEIWNTFLGTYAETKTFFHGHTYGGNPLAAAVALASLEVFDNEQTLAKLPEKIARLREHLERIGRLEHVGDVRQRGLMAGIELVADRELKTPYPWQERRGTRACTTARDRGVFLRPLGDVVVIMPPLAVRLDELDRICTAAEEGVHAATVA